MLNTLKDLLKPPRSEDIPRLAGYEAIGGEEEASRREGDSHLGGRQRDANEKGVYGAFWVLGAGVLLAWNVLICTMPLLSSFFPDGSPLRSSLASWLSSVYCFGNLFFLGLAQKEAGKMSPSRALQASLVLLLLISIVVTFPLLPLVIPRIAPTFIFPILIVVVLLLSLSTAILQWAVFALASLWSSTSVLAVMSGQGGIAVLVSFVQVFLAVFSALGTKSTPRDGDSIPVGTQDQSTLAGVGLWALGAVGTLACMSAHRYLTQHPDYFTVLAPIIHRREEGENETTKRKDREVLFRVFKKNAKLEFSVAWVFIVTLSVFPPVTSRILSVAEHSSKLLQPAVFIPMHFFIFNVGDYIGRTYLSTIPTLVPTSQQKVQFLSLARTIFIPLFLACNVTPRSSASVPLINSDVFYFLIVLAFGLTNGWISSICMILASSPALNSNISDDEKDVAGTLAAFCLVAGLAGGSICSFGVSWLVSGSAMG